jgi:hypothetical protein
MQLPSFGLLSLASISALAIARLSLFAEQDDFAWPSRKRTKREEGKCKRTKPALFGVTPTRKKKMKRGKRAKRRRKGLPLSFTNQRTKPPTKKEKRNVRLIPE